MKFFFVLSVCLVTISASAEVTSYKCQSLDEDARRLARASLKVEQNVLISGDFVAPFWNGFQRKFIDYKFLNQPLKPRAKMGDAEEKNGDFYTSSSLQAEPPRYKGDSQYRYNVDQRQISSILVWVPKSRPKEKPFSLRVFFVTGFYLHDFFVDGWQVYWMKCTPH